MAALSASDQWAVGVWGKTSKVWDSLIAGYP